MHKNKILSGLIFLSAFTFFNLNCFLKDFIESVKVIHVHSLKQRIIGFNKVVLEGDVEVIVDKKMHLWADKIVIDKDKQILLAQKKSTNGGCVVIEDADFLILADKFFLNLEQKTGYANNIRIHVAEGYIRAGRAEKRGESYWKLKNILFTPCDAPTPHWSIVAKSARLYNNYFVRVTGVLFKTGDIPFFVLPKMIIPIQNRSKSGFLVPKFSYDEDFGFGFEEEFYWLIGYKIDNTTGIDCKNRKGIGFYDQFRWVRSPEDYTDITGRLAKELDASTSKKNRIVPSTGIWKYGVDGKDFRSLGRALPGIDLYSLVRVDFGSDKMFGYQFFDQIQTVDDTFYNSLILRNFGEKTLLNFAIDWNETVRKQFFPLNVTSQKDLYPFSFADVWKAGEIKVYSKKKEIDEDFTVCKLPHLELNSIYRNFKNFFYFRQDAFVDRIFSRDQVVEKIYIDSKLARKKDLVPLQKADTLRFYYQADLGTALRFKDQTLNCFFSPNFQLRSNLKHPNELTKKNVLEGHLFKSGAYRLFYKCGAEWAFPESVLESEKFKHTYYFQPMLKWNFVPKFKQDQYFYSDQFDRAYPQNEVGVYLRNNWVIKDLFLDVNVGQFFDFYNRSDIYPMRRCPEQNNLLPLQFDIGMGCDVINFFVKQEYNLRGFELLQNEATVSFDLDKFHLSLSTLYQDYKLRKVRELLSTVPHSLLFSVSIPVSKNVTISYNGQFYSEKNSTLIPFDGLKPLLHKVALDFEGHCWGVSLGFEEKRYREYGNWKSEKAFTLYVRLESLGSFAKKFKRPMNYVK